MNNFRTIDFSGVDRQNLMGTPSQSTPNDFSNVVLEVPERYKQFSAGVLSAVQNYIAMRARTNRFRMVHYNMMVSNNFSNPELRLLSTMVLTLSASRVNNGEYSDMSQAVNVTMADIIDSRINFIVISDHELSQLAGGHISEIRSSAETYVRWADTISDALQKTYIARQVDIAGGRSNGGFGNNNNGNNGFGGFGNNGNNNGGNESAFRNNHGFGNSGGGFGGGNQTSVASSVFERVSANGTRSMENTRRSNGSKNAFLDIPVKTFEEPQPKAVTTSIHGNLNGSPKVERPKEEAPAPINRQPTKVKWEPHDGQKYPLAYLTGKFSEGFETAPKANKVVQILYANKDYDMDRSRHTLATAETFLRGTSGNTLESRDAAISGAMEKATIEQVKARAKVNTEEDFEKRLNDMRNGTRVVFDGKYNSLDEVISMTNEASLAFRPENEGVYYSEFVLTNDFPILETDWKEFSKIKNYRDHKNMANFMKFVIGDKNQSVSLRRTFVQLNAYLARCFEDFVRFYMAIDLFANSDSYVDDVEAMIEDVGKTLGDSFKERILENQEKFFNLYLNIDKSTEDGTTDPDHRILSYKDDAKINEDLSKIRLVQLTTPALLLCTEFIASEYKLNVSSKIGSIFNSKSIDDSFVQLAASMVRNIQSRELGQEIKRFFIVTLDGFKYEINVDSTSERAPMLIIKR